MCRWCAAPTNCGASSKEVRKPLLRETGGLMIGRPDSALVVGSRRSADQHGLPHEILTGAQVADRFPGLPPSRNGRGLGAACGHPA